VVGEVYYYRGYVVGGMGKGEKEEVNNGAEEACDT